MHKFGWHIANILFLIASNCCCQKFKGILFLKTLRDIRVFTKPCQTPLHFDFGFEEEFVLIQGLHAENLFDPNFHELFLHGDKYWVKSLH